MTISWKEFDTIDFQNKLKTSSRRVLLLDYDGTLAPFRDAKKRNMAYPYEGVREVLSTIMNNVKNRVVIISARPVSEILALLGLNPPPEVWGIYGWERLFPNGKYFAPEPKNPEAVNILKMAIEWGKLNQIEWEAKPNIEKPASVAFHWRVDSDTLNRAPEQLQELIEAYVTKLTQNRAVNLISGDYVCELLLPGKNKGDAVKAILVETPKSNMVAYLGDSAGDEDAFEVLAPVGLGVWVNSEFRQTSAKLHITPPKELIEFLTYWCK